MTPEIKRMILKKAKIYRHYVKYGRRCKSAVKEAKSNYFSSSGESLNNPVITPKKYWSILHSFLHKRKIPKISPIRHNNMFLTDTLVKANTLNSFFAKQCSLFETGSELPADLLTHHRLESVNLDPANILSIIHAFDVSKAHMSGKTCLCILSKFVMNPWLSLFLIISNFRWRQGTFRGIGKEAI